MQFLSIQNHPFSSSQYLIQQSCSALTYENKFKNISIPKYILLMKQHHLNPQILLLHSPLSSKHSNFNQVETDIEYNLCHSFMRITGDQLVSRQLQMMIQSKKLIDILIEKTSFDNASCLPSKYENSLSSEIKDEQQSVLRQNDGNVSVHTRSKRIISRKNNKGSGIQGSNFSESLQDVRQNCSRSTFDQIKTLLNNYKSLEEKLRSLECRQNFQLVKKNSSPLVASNNEYFQQIVKLTARNNKLEQELKLLKQKNNSSPTIKNQESSLIDHYCQKKYQILIQKQSQMNQLSGKIHSILEAQFIEKGCERCCGMMKKVKDSLVKYRNCLQDQLVRQVQIFESYEKSIKSLSNKP